MIKKFLLAVTLAVTSAVSFASTGLYVQGDVVASKLEAKANGVTSKKNKTGFRVAVGKDTGNVRYEVDYTHFGKLKGQTGSTSASVEHQGLGLSAIYDFDTKTALTPYVGARLGLNHLKTKLNSPTLSGSTSDTKVGAGVLGGVQYNINNQFAVNAGVEYNFFGEFENIKFNQYGASVGVRYNF